MEPEEAMIMFVEGKTNSKYLDFTGEDEKKRKRIDDFNLEFHKDLAANKADFRPAGSPPPPLSGR